MVRKCTFDIHTAIQLNSWICCIILKKGFWTILITIPTKVQPKISEETFQPESGKIAGEGTFYVHREREGERTTTKFEKCPPQHTVNLKRAAEWNRKDIHSTGHNGSCDIFANYTTQNLSTTCLIISNILWAGHNWQNSPLRAQA